MINILSKPVEDASVDYSRLFKPDGGILITYKDCLPDLSLIRIGLADALIRRWLGDGDKGKSEADEDGQSGQVGKSLQESARELAPSTARCEAPRSLEV